MKKKLMGHIHLSKRRGQKLNHKHKLITLGVGRVCGLCAIVLRDRAVQAGLSYSLRPDARARLCWGLTLHLDDGDSAVLGASVLKLWRRHRSTHDHGKLLQCADQPIRRAV